MNYNSTRTPSVSAMVNSLFVGITYQREEVFSMKDAEALLIQDEKSRGIYKMPLD